MSAGRKLGAGIALADQPPGGRGREAGEPIGLEELSDGLWNIVCYGTRLGRIDERTGRISGVGV